MGKTIKINTKTQRRKFFFLNLRVFVSSCLKKQFFFFLFLGVTLYSVQSQTIRYDTVPDPRRNNTEHQLFTIEQPRQQVTSQQQNSKHQEEQTENRSIFDKNKLVFGGSFGLIFGDYTALNISPQIGYAVNKYFTWGAGIGYSYYKWDEYPKDISYNYFGFNLFGRVNPVNVLALQIQPEIYRMWGSHVDSQAVPCILVGGGFYVPMGRGAISTMIYYDLVQNTYSPYRDQIIYSVGYVFNF